MEPPTRHRAEEQTGDGFPEPVSCICEHFLCGNDLELFKTPDLMFLVPGLDFGLLEASRWGYRVARG